MRLGLGFRVRLPAHDLLGVGGRVRVGVGARA